MYLAFRKVVDILLAESIPETCIAYVQALISEFLELFTEQFPDTRIIPKLHYLLHYPEFIMLYGPPRRYWGMRFEAKHAYFKAISLKIKNFLNIPKTLATRHQHLQAYQLSSQPFIKPLEVTGSTEVNLSSIPHEIRQLLPAYLKEETTLSTVKMAVFNSCRYRVGDAFVLSEHDDILDFAEVHSLLVKSGTLFVIARHLTAVEVSKHRCSHIVERCDRFTCLVPDLAFDFDPLDIYVFGDYLEIVTRYAVLQ